jgi:Flp pilus assembly protein TadG
LRTIAKEQCGTTAVEMALVLPLLILVIMQGIDFTTVLYNKNVITNASREGARAGVVVPIGFPGTSGASNARIAACNYISTFLITYKTSITPPTGTKCANSDAYVVITDASSPYSMGQPLMVTVNYKFSGLSILGNWLSNPLISAKTTMLYE